MKITIHVDLNSKKITHPIIDFDEWEKVTISTLPAMMLWMARSSAIVYTAILSPFMRDLIKEWKQDKAKELINFAAVEATKVTQEMMYDVYKNNF